MTRRQWAYLMALLMAVVVILVFRHGLDSPLIFDDFPSIKDNPSLRGLWRSLFTPKHMPISGRPLVNFTMAINFAIHQQQVWGYHAINLMLHAACGWVLFGVVRRTLDRWMSRMDQAAGTTDPVKQEQRRGFVSVGLSLVATLMFLVHPINSETVVYITQRTELMVVFFYLLTFYLAIRSWESSRPLPWQIAAGVAAIAGAFCKEVMFSIPLAVLWYDRVFVSESYRQAIKRSWKMYVGLMIACFVTLAITATGPRSDSVGFHLGMNPLDYLVTQTQVLCWYLKLMIWPRGLQIMYNWPMVTDYTQAIPQILVMLLFFGLTVWGIVKAHPLGFLGAICYLILGPSSSFVPVVTEVVAERRMYLPSACLILIVFVGSYFFLAKLKRWPLGRQVHLWIVGGLFLAGILGYVCWQRVELWRSDIAVYQDVINRQPDNADALNNLGATVCGQSHYEWAMQAYRVAISYKPQPLVFQNIGGLLIRVGQAENSLSFTYMATLLQPNNAGVHNQYGVALAQNGRVDESIERFERALLFDRGSASLRINMGVAHIKKQNYEEAAKWFRQALEIDPSEARNHYLLGRTLLDLRQPEEAIVYLQKALKKEDWRPETHFRLGVAHAMMERYNLAEKSFRRAIQLRPAYGLAWLFLGDLLMETRRVSEAITAYETGLKFNDADSHGYNQYGIALAQSGRIDEALTQFVKAVELRPDYQDAKFNVQKAAGILGKEVTFNTPSSQPSSQPSSTQPSADQFQDAVPQFPEDNTSRFE